jgi:hypothetical protein
MASAWIVDDSVLQAMLQDYVNALSGGANFHIDLYQNNHTPAPGDTVAAYVAATFAGYATQSVNNSNWGSVTVTSHVASSTNGTVDTFTASSVATPQVVYGYFVQDTGGTLKWAEMFANPITVNPGDNVNVTPVLRHTTYP